MTSLTAYCGRCFKPLTAASGGVILSCSDFLCLSCCKICTSPNGQLNCPACGKRGVNSMDITDQNMIDEVKENLLDAAIMAQKVNETAKFQINHYKLTIRRMQAKIVQLSKDNANYKRTIEEMKAAGNVAQYQSNESLRPRTQQASLNSMLTNPIQPAMQPPERRFDDAGTLGKRPDTSQEAQFSGRATQSQHLAAPSSAQQGYKRVQTANGRLGTGIGPGGQHAGSPAAGGSFQRAVEVSRSVAMPSTPAADSFTYGIPQQPQPAFHQVQQLRYPEPARDDVDWGFGQSSALAAHHTVTPAPSQAPSASSYQQARPHTVAGALGPYYSTGAINNHAGQQQTAERTSTPTNMGRPPSASKSPSFATPSRLRSPHPTIPRTGNSGGSGRPGSKGLLSNPMHGVAVNISQNQSSLQGYLQASGAYNTK